MKKLLSIFISIFLFTILANAQYQVGTQSLSVQDPTRGNRNIGYEVCYPAITGGANATIATGQFPVIVFGHGFGISVSEYDVWCNAYAAKGYIIAFPTTEGSVFPFPNHGEFSADLSFLIDHLLGANTPFPGNILGTSAVMGHSMGGGASWAAAANNPNITTMVTLAAAETNAPVSSIGAAPSITIPTLTLAGTSDCVVMNGGAPIDMYNALPTGPYHVYLDIIGGSHCQFGAASAFSLCTTGEFCSGFISLTDQHNQMLTVTCNWMDYYLKDDCQAFLNLQTYIDTNEGSLHNSMEMGTEPVTSCCAGLDLNISFDGFPSQTSWDILDANGAVVATSGGTYTSQPALSTLNLTSVACLPDGCYTLNVNDALNNGMCPFKANAVASGTFITPGTTIVAGSIVATFGLGVTPGLCGNYSLVDANGAVLASGGGSFGAQESNTFCLVGGVAQREAGKRIESTQNTNKLTVYPTLSTDFINLEFGFDEETRANIYIYDINGKLIQQYNNEMVSKMTNMQLNISSYNKGSYLIQLITKESSVTKRFIKG